MNEELVLEWAESPVTQELHKLISSHIEELRAQMGDLYVPYEAAKTQELMATMYGALDTWFVVQDLLKGSWEIFEEEEVIEDGESVGH